MQLGQVPYRREGVRSRWRHLRAFWSRGAGPGMVACDATYTAVTSDGRRPVVCVLRRRPGGVHEGKHLGFTTARGMPIVWA